jgi:excisionase family DNA binding protein
MSVQIQTEVLYDPDDPLLRPRQAAHLLGVEPRTVSNWARDGILEAHRTAGGHHRFRLSTVLEFARTMPASRRPDAPWWS